MWFWQARIMWRSFLAAWKARWRMRAGPTRVPAPEPLPQEAAVEKPASLEGNVAGDLRLLAAFEELAQGGARHNLCASEEPESPPQPAAAKEPESKESAKPETKAAARAVKVDTAKLDYLVDMVGEMVIAQSLVRHDPDLQRQERPALTRNLAQLARITDEVQRTAMSMRMVPVGH